MTRKTKIVSAVIIALLLASLVNFFIREFSGEVKVTLAGVSPERSDIVLFTVANTSINPVVYYLEGQENSSGGWTKAYFHYTNYTGKVMGRSAETIGVKVPLHRRWRIVVMHGDSWSSSSLARLRRRLAHQATGFKMTRLSQWLQPKTSFQPATGPEFTDHTPTSPVPP